VKLISSFDFSIYYHYLQHLSFNVFIKTVKNKWGG